MCNVKIVSNENAVGCISENVMDDESKLIIMQWSIAGSDFAGHF